jgi:hypothetical protein
MARKNEQEQGLPPADAVSPAAAAAAKAHTTTSPAEQKVALREESALSSSLTAVCHAFPADPYRSLLIDSNWSSKTLNFRLPQKS